jgi:hypothetical protein
MAIGILNMEYGEKQKQAANSQIPKANSQLTELN